MREKLENNLRKAVQALLNDQDVTPDQIRRTVEDVFEDNPTLETNNHARIQQRHLHCFLEGGTPSPSKKAYFELYISNIIDDARGKLK